MPATTVVFEDVDAFKEFNFPITYRVLVDHSYGLPWSWGTMQVRGGQGGWVDVPRGHALWPVLNHHATSDAGFGVIEDQIAQEAEEMRGQDWDESYLHAAE